MRVLLVEPQKVPREIEIPEGLKALQEAVGELVRVLKQHTHLKTL